jgi:hypothetical protein
MSWWPLARGAALTLRERRGHGGGSEREVVVVAEEEAWRSRRVVDLNADDAIGAVGTARWRKRNGEGTAKRRR